MLILTLCQNKKPSINIVDEGILPQADYSGSVSGAKRIKAIGLDMRQEKPGK